MEGKIGDLGAVRLVDPTKQSRMTKAPGTVDFMPPEALAAGENIKYEKELDVFSFGCVMLHTLSHQWPTPSEPVVTDPITFEMKAKSEVERRSNYFSEVDEKQSGVLFPMIKSCLHNIPKNRALIVTVCNQLGVLVEKQNLSTDIDDVDLSLSALKQKMEGKDNLIQSQAAEIEALRSRMAELQIPLSPKAVTLSRRVNTIVNYIDWCGVFLCMYLQVNKSSSDFWNSLKLTWQQCVGLPVKCWVTSVAELDGKVYITTEGDHLYHVNPLMYDSYKDQWSTLPNLPYAGFSLVTLPYKKQLLAIGGMSDDSIRSKVFAWEEDYQKWTTPYPNMPTARYKSCSISHGSAVIVAGGITCRNPFTVTGAVEVLHIDDRGESYWTEVKQLPYVAYELVPIIVDNDLYIGVGFDDDDGSTCNLVTTSLPELLQSGVRKIRSGRLWNKMPALLLMVHESISRPFNHLYLRSSDRTNWTKQVDLGTDTTDSPLQSWY